MQADSTDVGGSKPMPSSRVLPEPAAGRVGGCASVGGMRWEPPCSYIPDAHMPTSPAIHDRSWTSELRRSPKQNRTRTERHGATSSRLGAAWRYHQACGNTCQPAAAAGPISLAGHLFQPYEPFK